MYMLHEMDVNMLYVGDVVTTRGPVGEVPLHLCFLVMDGAGME